MSNKPLRFKRPWFSFVLLILLGEWLFMKKSLQRIKAIDAARLQEYEEKIKKAEEEKKEFKEKKAQDELERILGWGYQYPYLPSLAYAPYPYLQNASSSTGNPWIYNGEIVQWSK